MFNEMNGACLLSSSMAADGAIALMSLVIGGLKWNGIEPIELMCLYETTGRMRSMVNPDFRI